VALLTRDDDDLASHDRDKAFVAEVGAFAFKHVENMEISWVQMGRVLLTGL
jgi:hypothetical protein